ncbi:TPA: multidrug transporter subunit MdtA, partial [Klebsiella pneumoniae]
MKGSNIRRWGAALAVVIIAGAAYWFWHDRGTSGSSAPAAGQGPQGPGGARHGRFGGALAPVQAATATEQAVPRYLTGLGTVTAANTVTVRSRVDGQLLSLHFQEGQ